MKKQLFIFSILFLSLSSWSQINTLPAVQSFDDPFTTGTNVEFLPNWTGNDVQASTRIFRDETDFSSAPAAMSVVPTGSFAGDVRVHLDLSNYADVSIDLLAKSVLNGTGDRSAILTIDTSIDGGTTWHNSVLAGTFPNTTQAEFTSITYSLPAIANNQSNVIVRMSITRSAGTGTTAKLVIDDVEIYESTSGPDEVLVHYWNFNDNSSEAAITAVSQSLVTGATLTHIPGGTSVIDFAGGTGQNFNVDNLNARNGDVAGSHLRFNDPIGGGLQFDLPTTGYENVIVKFATRRSGQGAGTQLWSYTVDGTNYIPFQNVVTFNANPILITLNFTTIPEANDNPNFGLLVEFEEGDGGTGGNNRFDNFTMDATPLESTPLLIASTSSLTFSQTLGAPSDEQTITVSGSNLTNNVEISAPANFEISLTSGTGFTSNLTINQTGGNVSNTQVFVRLNNTSAGATSGNLIVSSTGADNVEIELTGNTIEVNISNPTPFVLSNGDYTFTEWDENSPAGTFPANMIFWTHATTDPVLSTPFVENYNCLYNLGSRSRINGEGTNGFSFVNTGNSQRAGDCDGSDPGQGTDIPNGRSGAAVLALNTIDAENILVEWTARTIAQNNRVYGLRLQYRIGNGSGNANADWQDFDSPIEYVSGATGTSQNFATPLPEALENQSLVQLRWVYYYISGSGSRAQIALDDITISQVSNPVVVANPSSLNFTQILGSPSDEQTITVSGSNLTNNVEISAPTNFEISLTSGAGFTSNLTINQTGGNVSNTQVFVRLNNTSAGATSGNLIVSSTGADDVEIELTGNTIEVTISNPTPFVLSGGDYTFTEWDENSPAGTYPANMVFWTHATTDPDLSVEFIENWNCLYNLTNRSRINGEGTDGFSFVNTGNSQFVGVCDGSDPDQSSGATIDNGRSGAAVLALNTIDAENILVEWTARTIAQNNRVYGLRLQYRIGNGSGNANADWQDFSTPIEYISSTTGHSQNFSTPLPEVLENQSLVQLRWVYYYISGSGSRAQIALDDITISQGSTEPLISANPTSLEFTQIVGTPSEEQIITVSGTNLLDDISIIAPNDFEISLTSGEGFTNSLSLTENNGTVEPTSVYVRFNRETEGTSSGNILISSLNVATIAIEVQGTAGIALTTNPVPFVLNSGPYTFTQWDENAPAGTYPANMVFWTHATTDPDLDTPFIEDWLCLYNLSNRSRINGEGENGFSFVNTGNSQFVGVCDGSDPTQTEGETIVNGRSGTAVLALNTLNRTDITVLWTGRTIAQNNRVYGLRMQYRIGNGNGNANIDWQDFDTPVEYISGATGDNEDFSIILPEACEDQPLVQLRWVYYYISGSGSRAQIALDDIIIDGTPLSVTDFDYNNRFTIYPNPATNIVYFSEETDVIVYDITGKELLKAENSTQINVESFAKGVYLIRNKNGQVIKLIKK